MGGDAPFAADSGGYAQTGPGVSTPPEVLLILAEAFGADKIGETGYEIAAAKCCTDAEKADAKEAGSSLLYGELLPDGVSKVLTTEELGGSLVSRNGNSNCDRFVLEP